jgi:hypothetical protein
VYLRREEKRQQMEFHAACLGVELGNGGQTQRSAPTEASPARALAGMLGGGKVNVKRKLVTKEELEKRNVN